MDWQKMKETFIKTL